MQFMRRIDPINIIYKGRILNNSRQLLIYDKNNVIVRCQYLRVETG